ncbi:hypothetical protein SKAU_G00227780 [Synaphobranchus kaupii]|uniref:Uncharacterized protein n=1 Tax=Synaphobranchus kaupii TaxID=118154 RepID=A0A9Q1F4Z5_SYNKA|nr:hypothetical protein SKAU_G00227780 [Synaphobranchus kaupii]
MKKSRYRWVCCHGANERPVLLLRQNECMQPLFYVMLNCRSLARSCSSVDARTISIHLSMTGPWILFYSPSCQDD